MFVVDKGDIFFLYRKTPAGNVCAEALRPCSARCTAAPSTTATGGRDEHRAEHQLSAAISSNVMTALRGGIPIENVIAALLNQVEVLRLAEPVVKAVCDAGRGKS